MPRTFNYWIERREVTFTDEEWKELRRRWRKANPGMKTDNETVFLDWLHAETDILERLIIEES